MNEAKTANIILNKIDSFENIFVINDDKQLTGDARDVIALTPWERVARDNRRLMRIQLGLTRYTEITGDFDDIYFVLMKSLNKIKDITAIFPENTRFRFIKKIISRITRINLIPQQNFNNELTTLLDSFYSELVRLRAENTEMALHIKDLSEQIIELEEKL